MGVGKKHKESPWRCFFQNSLFPSARSPLLIRPSSKADTTPAEGITRSPRYTAEAGHNQQNAQILLEIFPFLLYMLSLDGGQFQWYSVLNQTQGRGVVDEESPFREVSVGARHEGAESLNWPQRGCAEGAVGADGSARYSAGI